MLNREDIKGIRTRLEEFLYWSESAGPYGNDIRALFAHVEELQERLRKAGEIAARINLITQRYAAPGMVSVEYAYLRECYLESRAIMKSCEALSELSPSA